MRALLVFLTVVAVGTGLYALAWSDELRRDPSSLLGWLVAFPICLVGAVGYARSRRR